MYIHYKVDIDEEGLNKIIQVLRNSGYRSKGYDSDLEYSVLEDSLYGGDVQFKTLKLTNQITEGASVNVSFNFIPGYSGKVPVIYRQKEMFEEIVEILKEYGEAEIV